MLPFVGVQVLHDCLVARAEAFGLGGSVSVAGKKRVMLLLVRQLVVFLSSRPESVFKPEYPNDLRFFRPGPILVN